MQKAIEVKRLVDFLDIAPDLSLQSVSVDWAGNAIMLFDEGRPAFPIGSIDRRAIQSWYKTYPPAHHVIRITPAGTEHYRFANSLNCVSTSFAQPFRDGWLLGDSRGGVARVFDADSELEQTLDLGDAIKDIQTTQDGKIWVSYFDEGVFGGGMGQEGLVCFNANGQPIFQYAELADAAGLPPIYDCYALNVCRDAVWASYYSEFPIVCIRDLQIERSWPRIGAFDCFAVRGETIFYVPSYGGRALHSATLGANESVEINPVDESGWHLADFKGRAYAAISNNPERLPYYKPFVGVARGEKLYLYTEQSLYEVP